MKETEIAIACCIVNIILIAMAIKIATLQNKLNDLQEKYLYTRQIEDARIDLLHNTFINNKAEWGRLVESQEYKTLDSLLLEDWEDFYL